VPQKRYLYIGMGDGGGAGDPDNNAQNNNTLLGKMLRLDPRTAPTPAPPFYTIPPDNPNVVAGVPLGTIWAKGLRNPWRFSFDARTGDLYIADVGQYTWEEVNFTPQGTSGGLNYGWRIMEGKRCFDPAVNCETSGLELPVSTYRHRLDPRRCAIIGGYVYRGQRFPSLQGTYIFADLCSGEIFGLKQVSPGNWERTLLYASGLRPLTFGENVRHELFLGASNGSIHQLVVRE
jgi:glucose/arabinose dehydrogenase